MFRIGCVSYLNAKPLIFGLDSDPNIHLQLDVPSHLLDGLIAGRFDVALLPVIDYQRMENLALLPVGGIGSEDETLTVRIFSKVPIAQIRTLACDPDSHTSVALARIILEESFHIHPEFTNSDSADAQLLIGDKVIIGQMRSQKPEVRTQQNPDLLAPGSGLLASAPFQLDLGSAWKSLTGLPFLFACWTARAKADLADLPPRLLAARRHGMDNIQTILDRDAAPRGWPIETARKYLTQNLNFEVGPRQIQAVELFHQLAARHGLIQLPKPLNIFPNADK